MEQHRESRRQEPQKLSFMMSIGRSILHGLLQCAVAMRSLIRTVGRYVSWRERSQTPRIDMTNAVRYMSKPENKGVLEVLNAEFKEIKKRCKLNENVSLNEFFKNLPNDPDRAGKIKKARYELAMFLNKKLGEESNPEKDVLIGTMARGLGVDEKHHKHRVEGNFEQETSVLLSNLSQLINEMESDPTIKDSEIWESKKSAAHSFDDEPSVSQRIENSSQSDDVGNELSELLSRATEIAGFSSEQRQQKVTASQREVRAHNKKPTLEEQYQPKLHVKRFDKQDFMENHARHLPKIINLLNHILTQATPGQTPQEQQELRKDMYKMVKGMLLQKHEPDKKQKGRFEPLMAHLKEELPSKEMSKKEINALNQRNEARDHLIATLVHTLIPSLKKHGDFDAFKDEFKKLLNNTEGMKDINKHLTPQMIGILRKPEHQDYAKNIIEVALYKILSYTPEQMHEDAQMRQKNASQKQQAPESLGGDNIPPQKGFVSFLVDKLLNSEHLSDEHLSQIMRDLKSNPLGTCATLLVDNFSENNSKVSLNQSFIDEVLLEDRRGILRFAAKAIMKVMLDSDITSAQTEAERQNIRQQKEASLLKSLESLYGEQQDKSPSNLSKLVEAVAYLAAGKEQKNKALILQGVDKMFEVLPIINQKLFKKGEESYLATQMARKLWKIPEGCSTEEKERHQNAQLSFIRHMQNSWLKNPSGYFRKMFADILLYDNIKKDYSIFFNRNTWAVSSESMRAMLDAYNQLDPQEKQCFNQGLPGVQKVLNIAQISYNAYDMGESTAFIIGEGIAAVSQEVADTASIAYNTGREFIEQSTQVLGGAYDLLASCWGGRAFLSANISR